jgi:hypothetical protein
MPFVYLDMVDSKDNLTEKHIRTIMHVHANYMNDFDWYISTNDDTYIVMENLKLFVQDKCPSERKLYGKVMRYGLTHVTDNGKEFHNDTNRVKALCKVALGLWRVARPFDCLPRP